MEMFYTLAEIDKLMCKACQEYLSLVLKDNWQEKLYSICKDAIDNNDHPDKYGPVLDKLDEMDDILHFDTSDMDIPLIVSVVFYRDDFISSYYKTRIALFVLSEDRNEISHSSKNETSYELYTRGLVFLRNIKRFVCYVAKYENSISKKDRDNYKNRYMRSIKKWNNELKEEHNRLLAEKYAETLTNNNKPINTVTKEASVEEKSKKVTKRQVLFASQNVTKTGNMRLGRVHKTSESKDKPN